MLLTAYKDMSSAAFAFLSGSSDENSMMRLLRRDGFW